MTRRIAALLFLALAACHGAQTRVHSVPGQGAVAVEIAPNPIVAKSVGNGMYEFPFDVIVRETGGRPIRVERVSATVFAGGGMQVGREVWDEDRIRGMGYPTNVPANGELRYHFAPRRQVPDSFVERLSAQLLVEAIDDSGAAASASTGVTVRR